ncbi:hypothetical protein GRX03_11355 [Halovenus sp. WSH3]|uniref:Uncharacterized protein n=1 Tax=Halovenus carboxidivorans TaxID=2692199 RepID=A0A6B0T2J4_9EURY|nr:DUF5815 family protein [Halovenus carboxidivorans]MXR52195.1 hypothetical protein [Halovenus carboxidivorans]
MAQPRVPGGTDEQLDLPCGETVATHDLDLGMRELSCECGRTHAVVMDVHPLGRFVPEFLVDTLRSTITTEDEYDEFTTAHALAMVREEYPDRIAVADCSGDGEVGYGLVWVADMDSRELHRTVVELLVELMEHAISHADDGPTVAEFEEQLAEFDLDAFVDAYRDERDFEDEHDSP